MSTCTALTQLQAWMIRRLAILLVYESRIDCVPGRIEQ